jgi:NADH-quinone oxidoreductase subunit J
MILPAIFFYLFAGVCIASAVMVVASRNPVHSVLFLILAFANAAGLFILLGAEFLAMILVIVYVGAVAVLFLFVVMMLDVDFAELKRGIQQYALVGAGVGLVLMGELIGGVWLWKFTPTAPNAIAGLVLLVAMIGAIVLTLRHRPGVRRQSISQQNARTAAEAMVLLDVKPGQGA